MALRVEMATCPSLCQPLTTPQCPTENDAGDLPQRQPLPSLAPTALVPSCVSQRAQAVLALSSIDKLRVVRSRRHARDAGERFVIELFTSPARAERRIPLATSARLPQVCSSPTACCSRPYVSPTHPTLAIEKRLAQFSDLRDALYLAVLSAHVRAPFCTYCRELINYSVWGNRLPTGLSARLLLLRDREETRLLALLEAFAADLLERTLHTGRADAAPVGGFCSAKTDVPVLVHAFLFGQQ